MASLTERAIKRRKVAVILVENALADVAKGNHAADFEWFKSHVGSDEFLETYTAYAQADVANYSVEDGEDAPFAFMAVVIPDTETMAIGTTVVIPETAATKAWRDEVISDITALYEKTATAPKKAPVVKARRKMAVTGGSTPKELSEPSEVKKPRVRRVVHKHDPLGPQ